MLVFGSQKECLWTIILSLNSRALHTGVLTLACMAVVCALFILNLCSANTAVISIASISLEHVRLPPVAMSTGVSNLLQLFPHLMILFMTFFIFAYLTRIEDAFFMASGFRHVSRKESPPLILLTLDTTFSSADNKYRMPMRAYLRTMAGIPRARDPHCAIFNPLRVELDAFPGECVAMQLIENALDSRRREVTMENGLEQLERSIGKIIEWL
ncbi:hypothetical protein KIN20_018908 [Parelaphostrongylus tenuis]|uniref:Uncharacterized protein n=1 Tax=Parelaphostrongylus tenuis TaxID=148309 RepID=A0AAD5MQJ4_PARTN|nr:hypothetical protein KIN20_018908 [Parelaphostrongylus tenuis]